ncbi:MAG: hypothetical protein A3H91_09820 [Gammaproteobacteria bacterium RIFCSPLOWO2_02_FULL_61_13]|nr:MAG: hypothetical protein A3H91_09820 [Gammaproteobacteria bacterium RIFCSPLOWO2_02_FULL_61_13]
MMQKILIIDDTEDVEYLARFCAQAHWPDVVLEMYDPRCGIPERSFNWSKYDLLLLDYDLGLKDENGLTWLETFRAEPKLPPVVMLTGYASDKLFALATSAGVDAILEKGKLTPQMFGDAARAAQVKARQRSAEWSSGADAPDKTQMLSAADRQRIADRVPQPAAPEPPAPQPAADQPTAAEAPADKTRIIPALLLDDAPQPSREATAAAIAATRSRTDGRTPGGTGRRAMQPAHIPILVPGYTITEKIGEGGMASIFLADRDEDGQKVVLKVLSLNNKEDALLLRRFMREYKLIGQLNHVNIAQIYERAFASNFAYIAMEYFSHGDLGTRLKQGVSAKLAIKYLHQITAGLGAAHACGIVHRDMKPANILFRSEQVLAITDFGIAKVVESDNMKKQLTMSGTLMGTLHYISPEQIMGREADLRSDLYSLGIIMYKMLTGKVPFGGELPTDILDAHLSAPIPNLPRPFESLQPLLDGLLAKDPDERFQSAEDLLMGLNWKEWE